MDKYKSLELFNIRVVRKRAESQFRIPLDDRLPTFENIIGVDNFLQAMLLMQSMIDDDALKIKSTRNFHIWCHECGDYIGFREFPARLYKENARGAMLSMRNISEPDRMQLHDAWCPRCHSITSFHIQEEIKTLY